MYNTIAQLQRISVKPVYWIATHADYGYILFYNHKNSLEPHEFCHVQNARGSIKIYKTMEALIKDVSIVDSRASILFTPEDEMKGFNLYDVLEMR